jgi:hypothetical protein
MQLVHEVILHVSRFHRLVHPAISGQGIGTGLANRFTDRTDLPLVRSDVLSQ